MSIVRGGLRDAIDRLFGAPPTVLNAPCSSRWQHLRPSSVPCVSGTGFVRVVKERNAGDRGDEHDDDDDNNQFRDDYSGSSTDDTDPGVVSCRHGGGDTPVRVAKRRRTSSPPSDQVVPSAVSAAVAVSASANASAAGAVCDDRHCVCANSLWTADGIGSEVMLRTAEELSDKIMQMYSRAVDPLTNQVDYAMLSHTNDFRQYQGSARKLRYFDPLLLSVEERKAFFLNVYNSLMIHAITVLSKPRSMFERISLYNSAAYNIGGRAYTLNMIEHGVLRANQCGNGPLAQQPFAQADARRLCALPKVDPRIHFALNCGARSCPPVRFYEACSLDVSLDSATRAYLNDLDVDVGSRIITLPKLLQWYKTDFCKLGRVDNVLQWTLPFLTSEKRNAVDCLLNDKKHHGVPFKVIYASYDWSINDSSQ